MADNIIERGRKRLWDFASPEPADWWAWGECDAEALRCVLEALASRNARVAELEAGMRNAFGRAGRDARRIAELEGREKSMRGHLETILQVEDGGRDCDCKQATCVQCLARAALTGGVVES